MYNAIGKNKRNTIVIMVLFAVFVTTVGYVYGKASGGGGSAYAVIAFIFALISTVGSYFYSDKLVLATTRAQKIVKKDNPQLFTIVENLAIGAGIPMPEVYIANDPQPNAFATGRDPKHAVVCVTTGLLERLNKVELEGVIAHELSHIKNLDIRLMAVVAILVGFVAILADMFMRSLWFRDSDRDNDRGNGIFLILALIFAILSPIIATLIQLAVSRKREFLADASGALLTRYPDGLADALEKIAQDPHQTKVATPATAHLFFSNPFREKKASSWFVSLFNTHPPFEERVKILREM
ncbi:MAG: M48 family metallopeptidase [Candidatus Levybacteria bacterium]|nr:M48 family metallopeptidase [Candidatus Levybacteria bacterium]